jgi:hypothetical protein
MDWRRKLLCNEVLEIVKNRLDRGEHPAQARVQQLLSAEAVKARRMLGRLLNEAMANLMIPHQSTFAE